VLDLAPDPLLLVSSAEDTSAARLVIANQAARRFFRIPNEGGLLSAAIRHPGALEAIEEALRGKASDAAITSAGAQSRAWRVSAQPIEIGRGDRRHALVLLRDETALRRAERMRADFIANASHELRTPLASLAGFIETLRGPAREDDAARERFLGIMSAQAGRMARLINDLLSLSRIELNEHIAPEGRVDMSAVVRDVLDAMGPPGPGRQPEIALELPPPGQALVRGDRDQLIQVAQNLVDNAVKYAGPAGRVEIRLALDSAVDPPPQVFGAGAARLPLLTPDRDADVRYATLTVIDSGPGIAREHLPRLSERFYRVEGQKSGEKLGTGLGLAIVKHVVNRHKGGLSVETAVGRGAAFTVAIPTYAEEPAIANASAAS
jgi:two-component system, OmpR family, phosphate regulon sensor histidine kinase PhoR